MRRRRYRKKGRFLYLLDEKLGLTKIHRLGEGDVLVATELSRISRRVLEGLELIRSLLVKGGESDICEPRVRSSQQ